MGVDATTSAEMQWSLRARVVTSISRCPFSIQDAVASTPPSQRQTRCRFSPASVRYAICIAASLPVRGSMTLMRTLERLGTGILLIALLLLSHVPADGALASADRAFAPASGVFTPVSGSLLSASGTVSPGSGILTTGNTVLRSMSGVLTPTVQAVVSASGVVAPTVQAVASASGALTPASQAVASASETLTPAGQTVASASGAFVSAGDPDGDYPRWAWPLDGAPEVTAPYRAPAHEYGPGHRGIDLASVPGPVVHAPADGVVAYRGIVVDRALLTIEHPGGYVSTFEPLTSDLSPGDVVSAGQPIGTVAIGGHAVAGTLHLGVRLGGAYINPMLLFGDVPRAVLLPCCAPL